MGQNIIFSTGSNVVINSGNEEIIWIQDSSSFHLSLTDGELQSMMGCCVYGYTAFTMGSIGEYLIQPSNTLYLLNI